MNKLIRIAKLLIISGFLVANCFAISPKTQNHKLIAKIPTKFYFNPPSLLETFLMNRWNGYYDYKYKTKNMLKKYWKIDIMNFVEYFSNEQRNKYKIKIINGRVCYQNGKKINSKKGMQLLFVLSPNEEIYILHKESNYSDYDIIKHYHSTLLAGNPVASAGRILDIRDGILYDVDSNTGHYAVKFNLYIQFIDELLKREYRFNGTRFRDYKHDTFDFKVTVLPNGFVEVNDLKWIEQNA